MTSTTTLHRLLPVLAVFLSCQFAHAQEWVKAMRDPNVNFYDLQANFNEYWKGKTIPKGKGYKAFRRWEDFMEPRVYPSGDMTLPSRSYPNYLEWLALQPQQHGNTGSGGAKSLSGNWTMLGPTGAPSGGGAGRINFVRFDPTNSNTIYVGAPDGGLWKSTNGGTSWSSNTDQLAVIGCSDIAIDPTNTQIMYLATGDGDAGDCYSIGVLKSTDGGTTWNTTGLSWSVNQGRTISRLLINPTNPQILLAFGSAGIYRTTNGGTTWTQPTGSFSGVTDAEFKPGDPNTIYAAGTSFSKSTNGGGSWTSVSTGLSNVQRISIAVTAANSAYVYLLAASDLDNGFLAVLRSTNSGGAFTTRMDNSSGVNILGWDDGTDTGGQGWYDLTIAASPTNAEEIYTGGVNVWKSTNGGTSFTLNTHWYGGYSKPYIHADIHDLQFLPGSGTTLFSGNDGGVFKTTNSGAGWSDISGNLAIAQQYRLGLSTSNANLIITGHQDNGVNKYSSGSWSRIRGGDGMDCFIDRTNNNTLYGSYVYGDYYKSTDGGNNWNYISGALPTGQGNASWLSVWHQDPVTANTLYAGGRPDMYKSTDGGNNWTQVGTPTGTGNIREFAIAPSNNQIIYAIKSGTNAVSKSTNGGTSFTAVSTGLPTGLSPTDIEISNTDPNVVFVTYSGYTSTDKVYKSTNGGTSWTNLSTGLPNIPCNTLVYVNNSTNQAIYVGTDVGVYYKDNTTAWIAFNTGLPNVVVTDLEIYYTTGRLRASTYGRGTWDSDLYSNNTPTPPVAGFTGTPTTVCPGQTVTFTNTSTNNPVSYVWNFAGGTPSTSTDVNPIITYNTPGTYSVTLTATNANGSDAQIETNYITVLNVSGSTLPFTEGFTGVTFPPTDWTTTNVDMGAASWARNATVGNAPTAGNSMFFDNFNIDDRTNTDEAITPYISLSGLSSAQMTFDVAYAPYDASFYDGLEVLISTDCGSTYTSIYSKSNLLLATSAAQTTQFVPTTAGQWRTETINLSAYLGSKVKFAFRNLAGYGNALYVDNINITGVVNNAPVASFTASPSTVCSGQSVQFNNTSTGNPTSYSWVFQGGSPSSSSSASPSVSYANAGSYGVTLTVSNGNGSNTTSQTITVNATPSISGTTPGNRCGTGTVTLGATASAGTLSWFAAPSGGTALGTGTTFTTTSLTTTTNYYVQATSNGCTSARTAVAATINAVPSVAGTTPGNRCGTGTVTLSASASAGTLSWYAAASGGTALGTGGTFTTPSISTTTTYYVEATNNGCTSARTAVVATINAVPSVAGTTPGNRCGTGTVTLSASASAGTLSWYAAASGGTALGTGGTFTTPSISTTTTYYVEATNNGCTSARTAVVATINAVPSVAATTPGDRCGTGTVTLSASASAGTLSWYDALSGGTALGTGGTFTTPSITTTTTYYVEVTNNGCTSAQTAVVATINAVPSIAGTIPGNRCGTGTVNLEASASAGTVNWYDALSGGTALGTGTTFTTPSISITTTYYAEATNNGCPSATRTAVTATVNTIPTVSQTPIDPVCVFNAAFVLTGGSPAGGIYSGTGVTGNNFDPAGAGVGTHTITYTFEANGCSNSASTDIVVDVCAGMENIEEQGISLYPNPTFGTITVEGDALQEYERMELLDMLGRSLNQWTIEGTKMSVYLGDYPTGTYTVRFFNKDQQQEYLRKIIIR